MSCDLARSARRSWPPGTLVLGGVADEALKTTILNKLKLGDVITTIPTIGFNVENVQYKDIEFNMLDVGGQDKIHVLPN